jgi:hypothetical protein
MFGLQRQDWTTYHNAVRTVRYGALRELKAHYKPAAVVAFGKGYWASFRELFEIPDPTPGSIEGAIEFHDAPRVVLAPFFGWWHMKQAYCEAIASKLHEWEVSIP